MLCIRACHGWYPVQTVERWGTHCAILQSTKGHWTSGALRRPGREVIDISLAIKSFNRIIRSHLKERECDSCESKASGTETERDSNKKNILAFVADDDDEEEEDTQDSGSCERRRIGMQHCGFHQVQYKGVDLHVAIHKGPGLQVQATIDNVTNIVSLIDSNFKELLEEGLAYEKSRLFDDTPSGSRRVDSDESSRVRFDIGKSCYVVFYEDRQCKKRRTCKNLTCDRYDENGKAYLPEDFQNRKEETHNRARLRWNELDKSDLPRFELPYHGFKPMLQS